LTRTGLPRYEIVAASAASTTNGYETTIEVRRDKDGPQTAVEITVETAGDEVTRTAHIEGTTPRVVVETSATPLRVVVDKYGQVARSNGGPFSILTFQEELERTLIVYGTTGERPTNREAAVALRQAIRERWSNITVSLRADTRVSEEELKSHHLL